MGTGPAALGYLILCAALVGCGGASTTSTGVRPNAKIPPDQMTCVHVAHAGTSSAQAEPCGGPTVVEAEVPAAVKQAGGRQLAQFELGRAVIAQSGCLACHKLGSAGNRGPGPDLTNVGARLSASSIRRTLIHPQEPMPSFKNLPPTKFSALVVFLSLLGR
jgi:mono/diheme cytochrome c family protein